MVESKALEDGEAVPFIVVSAPQEEDLLLNTMDTSSSSSDDAAELPEDFEHNRMVGAGVASGVVGLLLGGPFLAAVLGFGTAYATSKDGAAGDAARAVGEVALTAKAKAQQVDAKHNIVTKSKVVANEAWERAKEVDRQHNVLGKTKEFVVFSWEKILEINRNHRVVQRTFEGIGRALSYLLEKLSDQLHADNDRSSDTETEVTVVSTTVIDEQGSNTKK